MALRYLIDTDACVAFLAGADSKLRERWQRTPASQLALCSVVRGELDSGAWGTGDPFGALAKVDRLFSAYRSLFYDDRAASTYGRVVAELKRHGRLIGAADSMIAAIALTHELIVVTRNVKHFTRVDGLEVQRW